MWSASAYSDYEQVSWTIRAAAQTSLTTAEPKILEMYSCTMDAPSMNWFLPLLEIHSFIQNWVYIIQANMYPMYQVVVTNSSEFQIEPARVLETKLNAAIMIGGQSWGNYLSPRKIHDPTQGCLALRTLIPWSVAALFLFVALLTIGLLT